MPQRFHHALVTGGAGFIGSHIAEALIERGCGVKVFDNLSSGHLENLDGLGHRITFIEGDIEDRAALARASRGCDVVFHHAAVVSVTRTVENPLASARVNELGTLNVLEAARQTSVRRVILASSSAVYGDDPQLPKTETMTPRPLSPYAIHKRTNEQYARLYHRLYGLETLCLRYFNVYGPRQDPTSPYAGVISRFMRHAAGDEGPTIYGDGSQTRDFVNVADVVRANLLAVDLEQAPGWVLNIGTGNPTRIETLWRMVARVAGCGQRPTYAPPRPGDILHSYAGIQNARQKLDFRPAVSLEQGLAQTYAWYQHNGPIASDGGGNCDQSPPG